MIKKNYINIGQRIGLVFSVLILLIEAAVVVLAFDYFFSGPIHIDQYLPENISQSLFASDKLLAVQGQVTDIKGQALTFSGFGFDYKGKIENQIYHISTDQNTEFVKFIQGLSEQTEEPASLSDITAGDRLIVFSNSKITGKEFTASKIQILVLNFVNGQVIDIKGNSIILRQLTNMPTAPAKNYTIITDDQTEYLVKDYAAQSDQSQERAGSFNDVKLYGNITVYSSQGLAKDVKQFTASKLEINKMPIYE